ncbi:MAG: regulatory protein RecX [Candidatus Wallbacteria bacterium]|nr:regulatory protein RecX [Candidatus Wallbacteria bacterium]
MVRSSAAGTRLRRQSRLPRPGGGESPERPSATAREHGLELLGRRDFTGRGMLERLLADGYRSEETADAVAYLTESGYLDDRRFAERFLESTRARHGHGRAWLERELLARGVPRETVAAVLAEGRGKDGEIDEAVELARGMLRRSPEMPERKIASRLASRGFAWEVVRAALGRLGKPSEDPPPD